MKYFQFSFLYPVSSQPKQQMHYSDSSIIIELNSGGSLTSPLIEAAEDHRNIHRSSAKNKTEDYFSRLRDELGQGAALLIVLLSFVTAYQVVLLYLETFL